MKVERTLILAKHDGVQRGLIGEVIKRFEQRGLKLAGLKMLQPTKEMAEEHYRLTPSWIQKIGENTRKGFEMRGVKVKESNEEIAKRVHGWLKGYLTEGPIVAMLFEGYHAIEIGRKILGPAEARSAPVGTIRGDFSVDSYDLGDLKKRPVRNMVHASGNKEEAENEIKIYFQEGEVFDYSLKSWEVIH